MENGSYLGAATMLHVLSSILNLLHGQRKLGVVPSLRLRSSLVRIDL